MGKTTIFYVILDAESKLILAVTNYVTEVHGELVQGNSIIEGSISAKKLKYSRETILFKAKSEEEILQQVRDYLALNNISYIEIIPTT